MPLSKEKVVVAVDLVKGVALTLGEGEREDSLIGSSFSSSPKPPSPLALCIH